MPLSASYADLSTKIKTLEYRSLYRSNIKEINMLTKPDGDIDLMTVLMEDGNSTYVDWVDSYGPYFKLQVENNS